MEWIMEDDFRGNEIYVWEQPEKLHSKKEDTYL